MVIYDRARSSFAELDPASLDWARLLEGASWFHWSGITAALNPKMTDCLSEAMAAARKAGARISVDLNYRRALWSERQAQQVMRPLVRGVDLLVANEEDLQAVLGLTSGGEDFRSGAIDLDRYRLLALRAAREFALARVAITLRESLSASHNGWRALLADDQGAVSVSQRYDVHLVDRIGAGDSFAAGLIYGLVAGRSAEEALRFAVAASALKQTIPGDFSRLSVEEVDRLVAGDGSGRVRR
jgi:2-dehydro-3-deoxygluconokinase